MKEKSEIAGFLRANVAGFADFAEEALVNLVSGSRVASLEANEALVCHGQKEIHLGVVLTGAAVAWAVDGNTGRKIRHVESGDAFGVMARTVHAGIAADLVAESSCEVLLIPMVLFRSVRAAMPLREAPDAAPHFDRR